MMKRLAATYIAQDEPIAARKMVNAIFDGCEALKDFPHRGRPGRMEGRREVVFTRYIASTKFSRTPSKSPRVSQRPGCVGFWRVVGQC
jgi:plasmid stabilization system protein ParE